MNTRTIQGSQWSTASFGDAPETSPMELSALGEHSQLCQGRNGRMFALRCGAEAMHGFMAARFMTGLLIALALLAGAGMLWL